MTKLPWWETELYAEDTPVPPAFERLAGPEGIALVRAWPDGRTDADWGLNPGKRADGSVGLGFLKAYAQGNFNARRVLYGYDRDKWAFAIVMRSVKLVCIDIDGKNGGLEHVKKLGALPRTLAETSKSGDGYHLFYEIDDEWDTALGFGLLNDRIGIEQGVDIRGTGCVYHHKQQRWNGRRPVKLPEHLYETLRRREQKVAATQARIATTLATEDALEIAMLQDELEAELKRPMPAGSRNNKLFAIGSSMAKAGVQDWGDKLRERGLQVGLDEDELDKLIANISRL